jgi:hypothetical protein
MNKLIIYETRYTQRERERKDIRTWAHTALITLTQKNRSNPFISSGLSLALTAKILLLLYTGLSPTISTIPKAREK